VGALCGWSKEVGRETRGRRWKQRVRRINDGWLGRGLLLRWAGSLWSLGRHRGWSATTRAMGIDDEQTPGPWSVQRRRECKGGVAENEMSQVLTPLHNFLSPLRTILSPTQLSLNCSWRVSAPQCAFSPLLNLMCALSLTVAGSVGTVQQPVENNGKRSDGVNGRCAHVPEP
jgi:hypothetical protein